MCASIPPSDDAAELITRVMNGDISNDPKDMQKLQKVFPVLFDVICIGKYPQKEMTPILSEMMSRSSAPFKNEVPPTVHNVLPMEDEVRSLSYFSALPRIRHRRAYEADQATKVKVCTKKATGHPTLLPGVFTLFCQHGVCYGFQTMRIRESPNTAFTVLFERFESAPKTIVYDNSCNLHNYCLNREPNFFRDTEFRIDKFHWPNHTGCSHAYDMRLYPQYAEINSQVVEQANAALSRIKSSLSYMNAKNFMNHCKLFLWYRNTLIGEGQARRVC